MSDEEEQVEEDEDEEDDQEKQKELKQQIPQKKENYELNEFQKYNPHSSYANIHKQPQSHNPLEYYYQRQLPIPQQPSQYLMERVQYHQKEIDKAKQILLNVQKPQPNIYNMNHQPYTSSLSHRQQIESQMSQNHNKYIPPYQQTQYDSQPRGFNQSHGQPLLQPYHFNQQPPQQNHYQHFPQQNYYQSPQYDMQKQSSMIGSPNSFYSPYQNYPHTFDFQQQMMNEYPKVNLQKSKQVQTEMQQDLVQLPSGISQFQPEQPQPYQQQNILQTQPLSETELEYMEFLRYKEFNLKQQQQIDDQDFQDFLEYRKIKQEQLLRQSVDQEEEKRKLTDLYKWKNRQVYSEQEYKCQLDKKREIQQYYTKPLQQEQNIEINQAINTLIRLQNGTKKDFYK